MARVLCGNIFSILIFALALCPLAAAANAQDNGQPPQGMQPMNQGQLDATLAPIALYPDPLLSKVLIAATFPDQVEQAAAWQKAHSTLKGEELAKAVKSQSWDDSVKQLAQVTGVLEMMSAQRDWMYDLGGAFVNQQADVMASVQRLRQQAYNHGSLKTNDHQHVAQEGSNVVIQPADPQTVYVPYYNPTVVYGSWSYPFYPPYSWPTPYGYGYGALAAGIAWGAGIALAAGWWNNAFNWGNGGVWWSGGWHNHGSWNHGHWNNWNHASHWNGRYNNWHGNRNNMGNRVGNANRVTTHNRANNFRSNANYRNNRKGYNRGTHNRSNYNRGARNRGGYNRAGYNRGFGNRGHGNFNRGGFNHGGFSRAGFNRGGMRAGGMRGGGFHGGRGGGHGGGRRR